MIRIINLRKIFNEGKPNECVAVNGISLEVEEGKVTVFKGPSGSGKTTLLSLIGCLARPTAGRIYLREREITSLPEGFLTEIRRSTFGFIFQQFNLIKGLSVLENVMIPAYTTGKPYHSIKIRALTLLERFDLVKRASYKVEWLSGGEAQRVAIARALINEPSILIADEPTSHLDSKLALTFLNFMKSLKDQGKTILLATHDPLVYESDLVDRIVNLRDGRIEE